MKSELTPLMKQYWEIKSNYPEPLLFFRMGDFYELFHSDAERAAPLLGIALTSRNKKSEDQTPMCGIPAVALGNSVNKVLSLGLKVAICDQIEDPKLAKGLVKRAVTRVLSPGMIYDTDTLSPALPHWVGAWHNDQLAIIETTTGEARKTFCPKSKLLDLSQKLEIKELVTRDDHIDLNFQIPLSKFSKGESAMELLTGYLIEMSGESNWSKILQEFNEIQTEVLKISAQALNHLEIFETYEGETKNSFFECVNKTQTPGGSRLLRDWIKNPLTNLIEIKERQTQILHWVENQNELSNLRKLLSRLGDPLRRLHKIALPTVNARDLISLKESLQIGHSVLKFIPDELKSLYQEIEQTLLPEPPISVKQGLMIQKGVHPDLDQVIDLSMNVQKILADMEEREKEITKISSLKIKFNNIFGYTIEVTNTHKDKIPDRYIRKQTLANGERFVTPELMELETQILSAQERRSNLEFLIFSDLVKKVISLAPSIQNYIQKISQLDVILSGAHLTMETQLHFPEFTNSYAIEQMRHLVLEKISGSKPVVKNDYACQGPGVALITGPNMAGKSTLMRQIALLQILAQIGFPVPAAKAQVPLIKSIFTRVGASDHLTQGLSTFMVEMKETADILSANTESSLIIMDEIGRGTSTFDGMALAESILEYILKSGKSFTFFSTHYHELTEIKHPKLTNWHMSVHRKGNEIEFLYWFKQGPAEGSYGIDVAHLAGLPPEIIERARYILSKKESNYDPNLRKVQATFPKIETKIKDSSTNPLQIQNSLFNTHWLEDEIKGFCIDRKTPLEALVSISVWQKKLLKG